MAATYSMRPEFSERGQREMPEQAIIVCPPEGRATEQGGLMRASTRPGKWNRAGIRLRTAVLGAGLVTASVAVVPTGIAAAVGPIWYAYAQGAASSPTSCPETTTVSSQCSLTEALALVSSGEDVALATSGVMGTPSTYYVGNFTLSTAGTSAVAPVTIEPASGVSNPVLNGNAGSSDGCPTTACDGSVLTVGTGVYATVSGLTIENGDTAPGGSGSGPLGDGGNGGDGGGVYNSGSLSLTDDTVSGNTTGSGGAAGTGARSRSMGVTKP
jgi:hypothetical protein